MTVLLESQKKSEKSGEFRRCLLCLTDRADCIDGACVKW